MSGIQTYKTIEQDTVSARTQERRLLRRVTKALERARDNSPDGRLTPEVAQALLDNQSLWRQFALDVSEDDNALPDQTRADILSLAAFVEQRTTEIVQRRMRVHEGVPGLLDINETIAEGLSD
jgi:flagellar protein FlaF